jgi:two-component system KDP operon response regulator KdpE
MTHTQLLREVWGPGHEQDSAYLRIFIRQLRKKLEANPVQPRHLLTEVGVGYRFLSAEA